MINIFEYEKTCHDVVNVYDDVTIIVFLNVPVGPSIEFLQVWNLLD
jgi:hypothetical protein